MAKLLKYLNAPVINTKTFESLINNKRLFHLSKIVMTAVGKKVPSIELAENNPGNKVNISKLCENKMVVIFGVPGAFTPGCSKTHLPGYVSGHDDLKQKGVDEIVCISVNDAFVMEAWGKDQNCEGKVRMLADTNAEFVKALGVDINLPALGGVRSKRFSMLVKKGVISELNVEPDGTGLSCSLKDNLKLSL